MRKQDSKDLRRHKNVNALIAFILRWGMLVFFIVTMIGEFILLNAQAAVPVDYGVFKGQSEGLISFSAVMRGLMRSEGRALAQLGVLLLLSMPILCVAVLWATFILERDGLYVLISTLALTLILLSVFGLWTGGM